ncbi:MAG: Rha family transcriptional regulator, partial [Bacteroidales bacterium]|nr:Rha family transcriptional regulator [Bacteroidales bacterium]
MKQEIQFDQRMTSIEIAEVTGKLHKNVMQSIRNMEPAWEKITGLKFQLSEYKDLTGRILP